MAVSEPRWFLDRQNRQLVERDRCAAYYGVVAINALMLKRTKLAGTKSTRPQAAPTADARPSSEVSA